ncbi:DUF4403 family protein [Chryseolinea lacunae]|uniref:DUF4403 family protein n=1 Tax=Chryseolinea lacunae TaxID=2801331 RepID=A0ABS1KLD4_9BACT|nr:DUF4403 family protein [Chryseolinea lacunae]MBL0740275.1 DUF4403 family protein [Chryseolinea lacunae]
MKMKLPAIGIICLLSFVFFSRCERVKPEPPKPTMLDTTLTPPLSTVVIPVYYHVDSLEAIINNKVKGTFLKKWMVMNPKGDSLYLEMSRTGHLDIEWNKNALSCTFPLKVSAKFIKRIAGIKIKNAQAVEMEVVLHIETTVGIGKDWNLALNSTLGHITWVKDPVLKVGMVKVNLRKKVEEALNLHKEQLITKMDDALRDMLNTRKIIVKIWNDLQKPIRINKKGLEVSLKPYARDLKARLAQDGKFIVLDVELEASVQTILEGDDIPKSNTTLPAYKPKTSESDSLKIFVWANLPFSKANQLLEKELKGKAIAAEGYSATLKDITTYGTDDGLAVKVRVKGDITGDVYLRGTPYYDTTRAVFTLKDFRFDVDSENALINTADWMLHDNALGFVQEKLVVDMQPLIDRLPELIENGIEKGKSGNKINVYVERLQLTPQQILITRDNIQIILKATGKASIGLEKKVFAGKKRKKA